MPEISDDTLWTIAAGGVGALCTLLVIVIALAAAGAIVDPSRWRGE